MPFDGTELPSYGHIEKLDKAMNLIGTPSQWCKGSERNPAGQYCLRGALVAVGAWDLLRPAVFEAVREIGGTQFHRIEEFNDHPTTTHEDILLVLNRAREHIIAGNFVAQPARADVARSSLRHRMVAVWQKLLS
ncbi:MAG TPA: hypothetical protein VFA12_04215 [Stellaceae bacterium]|nr:hypothetical protein [Stellaceae bacterium]